MSGLVTVIFTLPVYDPYPSSHDDRPSRVRFRLPLDGPVTVAWGGPTADVNYHVYLPDQRWAYDLVVTRGGRTFRTDGVALDDYLAYGLPVYAPAAGTVFATLDGRARGRHRRARAGASPGSATTSASRSPPGSSSSSATCNPAPSPSRSATVVAAGQLLGLVGNSGNSSEPHVHLHLQDSPRPWFGEGIPFHFHGYRHDGRLVERGMPRGGRERREYRGQLVEHAGGGTSADGQ